MLLTSKLNVSRFANLSQRAQPQKFTKQRKVATMGIMDTIFGGGSTEPKTKVSSRVCGYSGLSGSSHAESQGFSLRRA